MNKTYEVTRLQESELENVVGGTYRAGTGAGFIDGVFAPLSGFSKGMECMHDHEYEDNIYTGVREIAGNIVGIGLIIGTYKGIKRISKIISKD